MRTRETAWPAATSIEPVTKTARETADALERLRLQVASDPGAIIRVRATAKGYALNQLMLEGSVFEISARLFSPLWMELATDAAITCHGAPPIQ